jgi:hypothetical protein
MSKFWNNLTTQTSDAHDSDGDSLKMVPLWSIILAIGVFALSMWWFNHGPPPAHRKPGSLPMHLIMGYTTGTLLASYALMVGFVSRDVKRRGMPAALWMLVVIFVPGFIGAVVYFLLRQPVMVRCPNCRTELTAGVHFCPQCRFQVAPVCGQCFRGVQITDAFCPQCGHEMADDRAPARLRAYSDS